jgi:predicted transcriptional regulator
MGYDATNKPTPAVLKMAPAAVRQYIEELEDALSAANEDLDRIEGYRSLDDLLADLWDAR